MKHVSWKYRLLFGCVVVAANAVPASAQQQLSTQGVVNSPGAWEVTQNISMPCNGAPLIEIRADDVTLDLKGFSLDCTDDSAPLIESRNFGPVVIRNGFLVGGPAQQEPLVRVDPRMTTPLPLSERTTFQLESLLLQEFEVAVVAVSGPGSIVMNNCDLVSSRGKVGLKAGSLDKVEMTGNTIRLAPLSPTPGAVGSYADRGIDVRGARMVELRGNSIDHAYMAIELSDVRSGVVENNLVARSFVGVRLINTVSVSITDNVLTGSEREGVAILIDDGSEQNVIQRNTSLGYLLGLNLNHHRNQYSDNRFVAGGGPGMSDSGGNFDAGDNQFN